MPDWLMATRRAGGRAGTGLAALALGCAISAAALADERRSGTITLFDGVGVLEDLTEYALGSAGLTPTEDRIVGLAAGYALGWLGESISVDVETQAVYHYGRGSFVELGTALVARWHGLTLPKWLGGVSLVDGLSIGTGPSVTTAIPPLESDRGRISHVLNQVIVELFEPAPDGAPAQPVDRVHHRSGIFGLINGIVGGSDYLGHGLRLRF